MKKEDLRLSFSGVWVLIPIIFLFTGFGAFFTPEVNENSSVASDNSFLKSVTWPIPDSLIVGIPVYKSFESLKPIFQFENDTTYVINFWATWCKPCIEELPIFEKLNSTIENEKIRIILVSLDFAGQVESKLVPFVQKQALKSKMVVLLDGKYNEWIDQVSPDWSGAIPATFIYKQAQNRLVESRFETLEELTETIKPFL